MNVNNIVTCEQDYKLPVNRIVTMNTMHMASMNMQNSRCEQDSPRYSGDYPVHWGLSCSREQDSPQ